MSLWLLRDELRPSLFEAEDDPTVSRLTLITPSLGLLKDVSVIDMELVSASWVGEPELELIIDTDTTPVIAPSTPSSLDNEISRAESSAEWTL